MKNLQLKISNCFLHFFFYSAFSYEINLSNDSISISNESKLSVHIMILKSGRNSLAVAFFFFFSIFFFSW